MDDEEPKDMEQGVLNKQKSSQMRKKAQSKTEQKAGLDENKEGQKQLTSWEQCKVRLEEFLDHNATSIIMTIITIYALFGDDIRILSTDKDGDPYFWGFNIFAMFMFTVEIVISSLCKPDYWNGFFFYLDVMSTLSLLLDIGWFSNLIFENGDTTGASSAAQLARASRASRIGTKAGRIVRIVRLIRLVKLYKVVDQKLLEESIDDDDNKEQQTSQQDQGTDKQLKSSYGKKVGDISPKLNTLNNSQSPTRNKPQTQFEKMASNLDGTVKETEKKKSIGKLPPINGLGQQDADKDQINENATEKQDPAYSRIHPSQSQQDDATPINKSIDKSHHNQSQQAQGSEEEAEEDSNEYKETNVGQKLSDLTTRRVITLVLSIMFSVPIFTASTYKDQTQSYDNGLWPIYTFRDRSTIMQQALDEYIDFHDGLRSPVIYVEFKVDVPACCQIYPNEEQKSKIDNYKDLRNEEITIFSINKNNNDSDVLAFSVMDNRKDNDLDAILSIVRTIFVSIVLSVGAMAFSRDVERLVVEPIEGMLKRVQRIAENPLEAAELERRENYLYERMKADKNVKELQQRKEEERMETNILEKLIIKIGALLAVGFGEAGSEIIAKNMKKGGAVNPLIPGQKILAIFGFCDIRNFTDATEVLQTDVMVFVNSIAEITHGCVDEFCGQSNKNIGDAFLLVWKYKTDLYVQEGKSIKLKQKSRRVALFSDLSVVCFVKIMMHLTWSEKLKHYRNNPQLCERVLGFKTKGVRMGFGLHQGWGIEGAIGSEFKIDASYLSPNVNMAARLEAATKQFGTSLLISGQLQANLTSTLKNILRHIDRVTVKGSNEPLDLYTVDVSYDYLQIIEPPKDDRDKYDQSKLPEVKKKKNKVVHRIKRDKRLTQIYGGHEIASQFDNDEGLVAFRKIFKECPKFFEVWNEGFMLYLKGQWGEALHKFKETRDMLKEHDFLDGPSQTLIDVIDENKGKTPSDWQGYRVLTEK